MWETVIKRNVRINIVDVQSWLLLGCWGEMIVCNLAPVSELHLPKKCDNGTANCQIWWKLEGEAVKHVTITLFLHENINNLVWYFSQFPTTYYYFATRITLVKKY